MLAAFRHQRHARAICFAMATVLDQWHAGTQPLGHHQMHRRHADGARRLRIACKGRVDPERLHVLAGGMQVQDVVGRSHHRAKRPGAQQFGAHGGAFQLGHRPDAIEVVHQLAALERPCRVKALVRRHIGKTDRKRANARAYARLQQVQRGHHAAELVAMGQGVDEHMRAGAAGLESVHVLHPGIAGAIGRQIARQNFEVGEALGHEIRGSAEQ